MCTWIRSCWRRYLQSRNLVCLCFGEFSLIVLRFWRDLLGVETHLGISLYFLIFWLLHKVRGILEQLWGFPDSSSDLKALCVLSAWIYLPGARESASDLGLWWVGLREAGGLGYCSFLFLRKHTELQFFGDVYKHVNHVNKSPQERFSWGRKQRAAPALFFFTSCFCYWKGREVLWCMSGIRQVSHGNRRSDLYFFLCQWSWCQSGASVLSSEDTPWCRLD